MSITSKLNRRTILLIIWTIIAVLLIIFFIVPYIKRVNFEVYLDKVANQKEFANATIAVEAKYEDSGKTLVSFNNHMRIHPGSNYKLFTAAASLEYLGVDFTFNTGLYKRAGAGGRTDLLLVGSGDPTFKKKHVDEFIEAMQKSGISADGDIYYDDSIFSDEEFGPGWAAGWKDLYFAVPITGLQIDDNLLSIHAGNDENDVFKVDTSPIENYKPLVDELNYFDAPESLEKDVTATMADDGTVTLHGDTLFELPFLTSTTVRDPSRMAAEVLKQKLVKTGLARRSTRVLPFDGDNNGTLVYEHKSAPLSEIVFEMLKFSKNNYAETLVRTLGSEIEIEGTQAAGVKVLKEFFKEVGLEEFEISAFDGSGLSPSTRATSADFIKLFDYINTRDWKDIFWRSLPESQVDGTLKYRFENAGLKNKVTAKTGTHNFSSSLSGKIVREDENGVSNGRNILFSIHVFNHPFSTEESVVKVIPVIDKIIAEIDRRF